MLRNFSLISLPYSMSVIYCKSNEVKTCWKCIHLLKTCFDKTFIWLFRETVASTLFKILYISSTFTNITTPFVSINLDILQNPLEQRLFPLSYVFLKNQSITYFASFFIFMLKLINLNFAFRNKNCCYLCRFYHECAFELTDWLIWLVHQFWLVNLNKHQLVEINSL